jgi:hypothetical protein
LFLIWGHFEQALHWLHTATVLGILSGWVWKTIQRQYLLLTGFGMTLSAWLGNRE